MIGINAKLQQGLGRAARAIATDWDASIQKNFQVGGRPKWPATRRGGAILQKSGRLAQSITVRMQEEGTGKFGVTARTNHVIYARIHQYGGIVRPRNTQFLAVPLPEAGNKRPKDFGDKLEFRKGATRAVLGIVKNKGKKNETFQPLFVLLKSVTIRARSYIVVQPEDATLFKQHITDSVQ